MSDQNVSGSKHNPGLSSGRVWSRSWCSQGEWHKSVDDVVGKVGREWRGDGLVMGDWPHKVDATVGTSFGM